MVGIALEIGVPLITNDRAASRYLQVNAKYIPAIINANDTGAMIMAYTPTRGIRPVFTST